MFKVLAIFSIHLFYMFVSNCFENEMNISFKAKYIMPVEVLHKDSDGYKKQKAKFYRLELDNKNDKKLIKTLAETWGDNSYTINLYENIKNEFKNPHESKKSVYVLTNQKGKSKILNFKNVLGIVSLNKAPEEYNDVDFLQKNPKYLKSKTYEKIGESIMDCIKILHLEKPLHVISDENAKGFYEKIGFEKLYDNSLDYIWYA